MKVAYIMRGVPGSGKSTLARRLVNGSGGVIHSTDDFFYVDGKHHFDPNKLGEYHDLNYEAFCRSLNDGIPVVVCDNTNSRHWHFERYAEAARRAGYRVAFVVMPHPPAEVAAERTIHSVPAITIQRMIDGWEN